MRRQHAQTANRIKIGGAWYMTAFARIVFRCEECLGELRNRNAGLCCKANPEHRGFIHRDRAAEIEASQAANQTELNQFYEIQDGKVVIKCQ